MWVGIGIGIGRHRFGAPFATIQWQLITSQWQTINELWNS